jgi:egghead protein (zeste-white 4 protein)
MDLNRSIKHILHVIAFLIHVVLFLKLTGFFENTDRFQDPFEIYGSTLAILLYFLKLLTFTGLPISLLNAVGILILDVFPKPARVARRSAPLLDPFISIRVVTRGSYPDLIRRNVERNLSICEEFGLDKFLIEIVTDREIGGLPRSAKLREIVVPGDYSTLSGTKFKARALQYALEPHVNILNDDDWIVHLDEETQLTHSALVGITNFLIENKYFCYRILIFYLINLKMSI